MMVWGNPEDAGSLSVEALKKVNFFDAPEMIMLNSQDFDKASAELLKQIEE
jgi:hypothetical protein